MIRRHLRTIALAALLCGLLAAGVSFLRGERYTASSTIELAVGAFAAPSPFDFTTRSAVDIERVLRTEREYLESREVFEAAARDLGIEPLVLAKAAEVSGGEASNTLVVRAEAGSFLEARAYSRAVADAYVALRAATRTAEIDRQIEAVEARLRALQERLNDGERGSVAEEYSKWATIRGNLSVQAALGQTFASIGEPPQFEPRRTAPGPLVSGVIGALLGAAVATGVLLLRRQTSDRIEHAEEAAELTGWGTAVSLVVDEGGGLGPRVRIDDTALQTLANRLDLLAGGQARRIAVVGSDSAARAAAVAAAVAEAYESRGLLDLTRDPPANGDGRRGQTSGVHVAVGASWVDQSPDVVLLVLTLGHSRPEEVRTLAEALARRSRAATALVLLEPRSAQRRGGHRARLPKPALPRATAPAALR